MTQAITLSSVTLRLIVSTQSAVCTSMIAALFLESRSVRRALVPWFSVMRGINDGPWKLLELVASSRSFTAFRSFEMWLTLLMIIVTLGLQFSSTILLSDLSELQIVGDTNTTQVNSLIPSLEPNTTIYITSSFVLEMPPIYPTFGEAQNMFSADPTSDGLSNTGLIQRALLPASSDSDRMAVRKYDGNAIILNSQVACMRPNISVRFKPTPFPYYDRLGWVVEGELNYDMTFQNAKIDPGSFCSTGKCDGLPFNCKVPVAHLGWQSTMCIIDGQVVEYRQDNFDPRWNSSSYPWSRNSSIALILATNINRKNIPDQYFYPEEAPYEEWNSYEFPPDGFINITLCFTVFNLERYHVNMMALGELQDHTTPFTPLITPKVDTTGLQNLMGVNKPQKNHKARGILDMQILGPPDDGPPSSLANMILQTDVYGQKPLKSYTTLMFEESLIIQFLVGFLANISILLCLDCTGVSAIQIDIGLAGFLNDVIEQTGRPANALLTLITVAWSKIYYAYLDSLTTLQDAQITMVIKVPAPGPCSTNGCRGFIAVTTLASVHLMYVAIITALYIRRIRFSRHGNIWHTISQLATHELEETLDISNDMGDEPVAKVSGKETMNNLVKLGRLEGSGRIEVIRIPESNNSSEPKRSLFQRLRESISARKGSNRQE